MPNSRCIQAAIIDLDGTMVDTLGDFEAALSLMLADFGLPPVPRSFIERTIGKGSEHLIRQTLKYAYKQAADHIQYAQAAIKKIAYEDAWQSYQNHYRAVSGQASEVYPGVPVGLALLQSQGLQLACLTNKPLSFALPLLKLKGLDGYFGHVFGGDSFERKKPDPLPVLKTCQALGSLPEQTLMVGDSSNDAQAAHAARCPLALVTYGYNHGEDILAVAADVHIDDLRQVSRWLQGRRLL